MTDVPRRLRPDPAKRSRTIQTQTHTAHSAQGTTAAARPVATRQRARPYVPSGGGGVVTGESDGPNSTSISQTTVNGGGASVASAGGAIAIGTDWSGGAPAGAQATAQNAIAIGGGAIAASPSDTVVGLYASTDNAGGDSVAVGRGAAVTGDGAAVAIGKASVATEFRTVAVGAEAEATGANSTALGAQTFASGNASIAVGSSAVAEATSALAIGCGSDAAATPSIAIGTLDTGSGVKALAAGTVAIGADSSLAGAQAHNENEFVLGTDNHIVIVNGKLVASDGSGGLWQIVVSTGGALSTVAYP